jgi:hypothetical protein
MSEEKTDKKVEIEFVYEYDPDYRIVASNGIWGGMTPRGDFRLDFFVESQTMPVRIKNIVEGGKLGKELSRTPSERLVSRRLQVGVLLSPKEIKSIVGFLNEQLKNFERITEGEESKDA